MNLYDVNDEGEDISEDNSSANSSEGSANTSDDSASRDNDDDGKRTYIIFMCVHTANRTMV